MAVIYTVGVLLNPPDKRRNNDAKDAVADGQDSNLLQLLPSVASANVDVINGQRLVSSAKGKGGRRKRSTATTITFKQRHKRTQNARRCTTKGKSYPTSAINQSILHAKLVI